MKGDPGLLQELPDIAALLSEAGDDEARVRRRRQNKKRERDPEMHQTKKGNLLYHGMNVHIGVDSENGLIHSVETTAANVHDLTPATELLHGEETVVYADAGYQGLGKREEMQGRGIGFRVAMRAGKRRALPHTPEGRIDELIETALAAGFWLQ